jgi:hypothetical protein
MHFYLHGSILFVCLCGYGKKEIYYSTYKFMQMSFESLFNFLLGDLTMLLLAVLRDVTRLLTGKVLTICFQYSLNSSWLDHCVVNFVQTWKWYDETEQMSIFVLNCRITKWYIKNCLWWIIRTKKSRMSRCKIKTMLISFFVCQQYNPLSICTQKDRS